MKVDYVHKDSTTDENIRKEFSDVIYPTMVIRTQAETIELQENKIERLNNIINELEKESYLGMLENQNNNEYAKGLYTAYKYINDKLHELKGDGSNGR